MQAISLLCTLSLDKIDNNNNDANRVSYLLDSASESQRSRGPPLPEMSSMTMEIWLFLLEM